MLEISSHHLRRFIVFLVAVVSSAYHAGATEVVSLLIRGTKVRAWNGMARGFP